MYHLAADRKTDEALQESVSVLLHIFWRKRKGRKYCSSECTATAQREKKRNWWRENRAKVKLAPHCKRLHGL